MVKHYKYIETKTKRRFGTMRTAAKAMGLSQADFKKYLAYPNFPIKKIVKPRVGGGMGLFRQPVRRRRTLTTATTRRRRRLI